MTRFKLLCLANLALALSLLSMIGSDANAQSGSRNSMPGASRTVMRGIIEGTQRCPVGDFGSPKAGFLRLLDVVAIGLWYPYHRANRA